MNNSINYKNYRIERISECNLEYIVELFKIVFNSITTKELVKKKHFDGNNLNNFFGFIAIDIASNKPAGHFSVYIRNMVFEGNKYLSAQSGDTMINPEFRKSGLIVKLAEYTLDLCKSEKINIITGFPNQYSYLIFIKKLGFKNLSVLINQTFLENSFEFHRLTSKFKILVQIHLCWMNFVLKIMSSNIKYFTNSNKESLENAYIEHDERFFLSKTNRFNKIICIDNTNIFVKMNYKNNSIDIGDLEINHNVNLKKIIKKLKIITVISGLRFLNFSASQNCKLTNKLLPYCKVHEENPLVVGISFNNKIQEYSISLLMLDSDAF